MSLAGPQPGEDLGPGHLRVLPPQSDPALLRAMPSMRSPTLRGKVSDIALDLSLKGGVPDIEAMFQRVLLLREQRPNSQEEETVARGN